MPLAHSCAPGENSVESVGLMKMSQSIRSILAGAPGVRLRRPLFPVGMRRSPLAPIPNFMVNVYKPAATKAMPARAGWRG